jgi:mono/diheme cytochrome c family protein
MIRPRMTAKTLKTVAVAGALAVAGIVGGCGEAHVTSGSENTAQVDQGAQLFHDRCSGCHTLNAAAAEGSATNVHQREHTDGPNFNQRAETVPQVLYAIRNGGFSGAIMPENIVVGQDAQAVAAFVAKYSGGQADKTAQQGSSPSDG